MKTITTALTKQYRVQSNDWVCKSCVETRTVNTYRVYENTADGSTVLSFEVEVASAIGDLITEGLEAIESLIRLLPDIPYRQDEEIRRPAMSSLRDQAIIHYYG